MRLIDADGLKNDIYESWGGDPYYHTAKGYSEKTETEIRAEEASLFLENIDAQPTIEPTKHGRWEYIGGYGYQYRCSNCVMCADRRTNYCPNCGARMQSTMGQVKTDEVKE